MNKIRLTIDEYAGITYFDSCDRIEYLQVINKIPLNYNPSTREDNFKTFEQRMKDRYE